MPATPVELAAMKKLWRAANYLSVAQIYLRDNILLERPLEARDIKPRLLGHWGTCPGINFVYSQINRLITRTGDDFLFVVGPGHGFPAIQANLFLEGTLTKFYPDSIPFLRNGLIEICSKFSAAYGYPSHSNPGAPGAILEGGELGYSLAVSFGSVLDNPELVTVCLVGDGESETGPLAAAWQANKLLSPITDGAVLPVVHANGYKISGPTCFGRMDDAEISAYFSGLGYEPLIVDESAAGDIFESMAAAMDSALDRIRAIQQLARSSADYEKPRWPVLILRSPKGWTGVAEADGQKLAGNCASHQVILADVAKNQNHLRLLEEWLRSYQFEELVREDDGQLLLDSEIASIMPPLGKTCGTQRAAFGGEVVQPLQLPELAEFQKKISQPGAEIQSPMQLAGRYLARAFELNAASKNLRLFSPDETYSNQLQDIFQVTKRSWQWPIRSWDQDLARSGRVLELLSEHTLFGMLQGYAVTGRFGLFPTYEAFAQVIASMADQFAKFVKASQEVPWRRPIPAVTVMLSSLLERQDHNGFSHQNPGFISNLLEKDGELISVFLPPDANSLLVAVEESLTARDRLIAIVADKKELPIWLTPEQAVRQMKDGIMTWEFASDAEPQAVLAASGDHLTNESLAAIRILKGYAPQARIRFVNVSELTALGVGDPTVAANHDSLDAHFTADRPVIFNFHGYPATIKKLLFDYAGAGRVTVHGYLEEGSTTTPFDMQARNKTSRFHIALELARKLAESDDLAAEQFDSIRVDIERRLAATHSFILEHGVDPDEITNWRW